MNIKPYDMAMVCGRFQHFHIGHESLVDVAQKLCDRILVLVGSAQEYGTERNPFDIETRITMIREIYGDSVIIKPINDLSNENDITPDWGRYILDNCERVIYKQPELMIYGNDDSRSRWFAKEDLKNMTELIINRYRSGFDISATVIRKLLVDDNRREWQKWVNPKLHKHYDRLRSELMEVDFYKNSIG